MPTFAFRARDGDGRTHTGTTTAPSGAAAAVDLRARGWLILEVEAAPERDRPRPPAANSGPRPSVLPSTSLDVELGLRQIALMIRGGLTLLSALQSAADNARRRGIARVWRSIGARIEAGSDFAEALALHPRRFPPFIREIVRAGEHSGSLDLALERCAAHLERRREFRLAFLQALLYPSIVLVLTTAVTAYLVVGVMPTLEKFLSTFHRKLPPVTEKLLAVSHVLREWLPAICVIAGGAALAIVALDRWRPARLALDHLVFRLPVVGKLRTLSTTTVFSRTLGTLVSNGVAIVRSLSLAEGILRRPLPAGAIARAREGIIGGRTLAEVLPADRPFTPMLARMVSVGERTGALDRVLEEVADFHEAELRRWIRRASTLIEPTITVLVGGLVGFVYIAFFLAMFAAAGAPR